MELSCFDISGIVTTFELKPSFLKSFKEFLFANKIDSEIKNKINELYKESLTCSSDIKFTSKLKLHVYLTHILAILYNTHALS